MQTDTGFSSFFSEQFRRGVFPCRFATKGKAPWRTSLLIYPASFICPVKGRSVCLF